MNCLCQNIEFGSYDNTVTMLAPFDLYDVLGEKKPSREVCIDICIATEIAWLWKQGIKTINSCCGHNKTQAWVIVESGSLAKMKELGYELANNGSVRPEKTFRLKELWNQSYY